MFNERIFTRVEQNDFFREVIATGPHAQIVVMCIPPGGDIGAETHAAVDQILIFVSGMGEATLDGEVGEVSPGKVVLVPAGTRHNFVNTGSEPLKLYTIYAPPQHAPGTIHKTKADAAKEEVAAH